VLSLRACHIALYELSFEHAIMELFLLGGCDRIRLWRFGLKMLLAPLRNRMS